MDTNYRDELKELREGKQIRCSECSDGFYKSMSEDYKTSCHFKCNNCGDIISVKKKLVL